MLYRSETWPMSTENERRLKTAETRMIRMMSGPRLYERLDQDNLERLGSRGKASARATQAEKGKDSRSNC